MKNRMNLLSPIIWISVFSFIFGSCVGSVRADNVKSTMRSDFDGFYFGAFGGYGSSKFNGLTDTSESEVNSDWIERYTDNVSGSGVYGAKIGFNYQIEAFLFGLEADLGSGNLKGHAEDTNPLEDTVDNKFSSFGSFRGRVGSILGNNTLLFLSAGIGWINTSFSADNEISVIGDSGKQNLKFVATVLGAGVEHKVSDNWAVIAESIYYLPSDKHRFSSGSPTSDFDSGDFAQIGDFYQIRVGINYGF